MTNRKILYVLAVALVFLVLLVLSVFLAEYVSESALAQETVQKFGYAGIVFLAFVGGFNLIIPIPAAAFAPTFIAAGFPVYGIIIAIAVGTTVADLISYYVGALGKYYSGVESTKIYARLKKLHEQHTAWVVPLIFVYAALAPYPNEVMIVPLAFLGVRFRTFILPVIIGNTIYNAVLVMGIINFFG
jgi:membrane protein YqaA with SNARE-associated domain